VEPIEPEQTIDPSTDATGGVGVDRSRRAVALARPSPADDESAGSEARRTPWFLLLGGVLSLGIVLAAILLAGENVTDRPPRRSDAKTGSVRTIAATISDAPRPDVRSVPSPDAAEADARLLSTDIVDTRRANTDAPDAMEVAADTTTASPDQVQLVVDSRPSGAVVLRQRKQVCTTPCDVTLPAGDTPESLVFRLHGYRAVRLRVVLNEPRIRLATVEMRARAISASEKFDGKTPANGSATPESTPARGDKLVPLVDPETSGDTRRKTEDGGLVPLEPRP
jgi:hypothetical protein